MHTLHRLDGIGSIALKLHAVAIVVVAARLAEQLLNIVAAGEEWALVVVVDEVGIPLGAVLAGKQGSVRCHGYYIAVALYVQQIQTLGQGVDQLLILSSILTQIDLGLAVAGIAVVLALVQEVGVGLVVVLVEDRHIEFLGQLPTVLVVAVIGMRARTGCTHNHNLGMSLGNTLVDILEAFAELGRDALLVTNT